MPKLGFGARGVLGFRALLGYQLCCKENTLGFRAQGFASFLVQNRFEDTRYNKASSIWGI